MRGYFANVAHSPVSPADLLPKHCFRRWDGRYLDASGAEVSKREPCGEWGLTSYRAIDDMLSHALGIDRVR
jgi:hypothetical protein